MKAHSPEISIIIPVYNMEKYIGECLDSVLNQTFVDFECLCINDGSTDGTIKILKKYSEQDKRIILIDQKNQGGSAARNTGIEKANGKYISFLDNDDLYHPQYLEILYHYAESQKADISICNYGVFFDEKVPSFDCYTSPFEKYKLISEQPFYDYIVRRKKMHMLMWTKLYRRELFDKIRFSLTLPAINDILLNLETLQAAQKIVTCKYTLVWHRILEASQTSQKVTLKKVQEYKDLILDIRKKIQPNLKEKKEKKSLKIFLTKNAYYNFVYLMMKFNDISQDQEIYEMIITTLTEFEKQHIISPNLLKLQDRVIYKAFKAKKLKLALRLMHLRDLLTH